MLISRFILILRQIIGRQDGSARSSLPAQGPPSRHRFRETIEGNIGQQLRTGFWSDDEGDDDDEEGGIYAQASPSRSMERTLQEQSGIETVIFRRLSF